MCTDINLFSTKADGRSPPQFWRTFVSCVVPSASPTLQADQLVGEADNPGESPDEEI